MKKSHFVKIALERPMMFWYNSRVFKIQGGNYVDKIHNGKLRIH